MPKAYLETTDAALSGLVQKVVQKDTRSVAKIFVADDSAIVRRCLTGLIGEIPGVEIVGEGSDSTSAITAIGVIKPHIVILEVHLRDGRGLDVLRTVKSGLSAPIVIVFSSYSYPQLLDACFNAGADFFYKKSHDFTALAAIIRRIIADGGGLLTQAGIAAAAPGSSDPSLPLSSSPLSPSKEIQE